MGLTDDRRGARVVRYDVSWESGGTRVTTGYSAVELFGPSREDEGIIFLEWLIRDLSRSGFTSLTLKPRATITIEEYARAHPWMNAVEVDPR